MSRVVVTVGQRWLGNVPTGHHKGLKLRRRLRVCVCVYVVGEGGGGVCVCRSSKVNLTSLLTFGKSSVCRRTEAYDTESFIDVLMFLYSFRSIDDFRLCLNRTYWK